MIKSENKHFNVQLDFTNRNQRYKNCSFYPCHRLPLEFYGKDGKSTQIQDELNCLFCYCPFYPCGNRPGNGKWIRTKNGKRVWDCSGCGFIHRDDVVKRFLVLLYKNKSVSSIRRTLAREFKNERN